MAQKFLCLLMLQKFEVISLDQRDSYGEIFINRGLNFETACSKFCSVWDIQFELEVSNIEISIVKDFFLLKRLSYVKTYKILTLCKLGILEIKKIHVYSVFLLFCYICAHILKRLQKTWKTQRIKTHRIRLQLTLKFH